MSITSKVEGDKLILTIDISGKPTVSKSAAQKAADKGLPMPAPTLIASSGGFMRQGNVKFSLNVTTV